jgi:hypothetical protein
LSLPLSTNLYIKITKDCPNKQVLKKEAQNKIKLIEWNNDIYLDIDYKKFSTPSEKGYK